MMQMGMIIIENNAKTPKATAKVVILWSCVSVSECVLSSSVVVVPSLVGGLVGSGGDICLGSSISVLLIYAPGDVWLSNLSRFWINMVWMMFHYTLIWSNHYIKHD